MKFYKHSKPQLSILDGSISYSKHQHEQIELCYILSGEMQYEVNNQPYLLTRGSLIMLFPYLPHSFHCSSSKEPFRALLFVLDIDFIPDFTKRLCEYHMPSCAFRPKELDHATRHALHWLEKAADTPSLYSNHMIRGWLTIVLGDLFYKHEIHQRKEALDAPLIHDLISYMEQHLSEETQPDSLCLHFGISRHYLSHTLKNQIYVSYPSLQNTLRLNHAEDLLRSSNLRIIDISAECGFRNVQTFSRNYKNATGLTPAAFQKLYRSL